MPGVLIQEFLSEPAMGPQALPEVMIAEAHHRIANNLTLIASLTRLQAREVAGAGRLLRPDEVQTVLDEVGARIETVGRLHDLLSSPDAPVDLGAYLGEVARSTLETMGHEGAKPRFTAELRGCNLEREKALQAALIVGELVTNSLKYAHPAGVAGEIRLTCRPSADGTLIEVSDDGVGFPEGFDPENSGGLGLRIVRALAAKLEATVEFEPTGLGLICRVNIPRSSPEAYAERA
jgi:two-component sensor histidine kinase